MNCTEYFPIYIFIFSIFCYKRILLRHCFTMLWRSVMFLCLSLLDFFYLEYFSQYKTQHRRTFYYNHFQNLTPFYFLIKQHPSITRRTTSINVKHPSGKKHEVTIPAANAIAHLPLILQQFIISIPFQMLNPTFILLRLQNFVTIEFAYLVMI